MNPHCHSDSVLFWTVLSHRIWKIFCLHYFLYWNEETRWNEAFEQSVGIISRDTVTFNHFISGQNTWCQLVAELGVNIPQVDRLPVIQVELTHS